MRPRCCLRYFTFFGINIKSALASSPTLKRARLLRLALLGRQDFAFVDPALHADHAVGGPGFGEAIFDISAQRVERQAALQVPFGARDFVAVQPAADPDFDPFATEAQRRIHRLAHGTTEADPFFQLQRDRLRHQLGVQFRLMHFLDVDVDLAPGALLHIQLELVDFSALAPDNDARTRRPDNHPQLVAGPLDFNRADACGLELIFQLILQLDVFEQQLVVIPLDKPPRLPRLGIAETKTIGMNFLSHYLAPTFFLPAGPLRFALALALAGAPALAAPTTVATASPFLARSASTISM